MSTIKDVTDLQVYQKAFDLLKDIYHLSFLIPDDHRKLKRQLVQAAEAIPPLLAEGFAKKRNNVECKRFFEMAMAESDETVTHLREIALLSEQYTRIKMEVCEDLIEKYKIESKQLRTLIKNWNKYPPK